MRFGTRDPRYFAVFVFGDLVYGRVVLGTLGHSWEPLGHPWGALGEALGEALGHPWGALGVPLVFARRGAPTTEATLPTSN